MAQTTMGDAVSAPGNEEGSGVARPPPPPQVFVVRKSVSLAANGAVAMPVPATPSEPLPPRVLQLAALALEKNRRKAALRARFAAFSPDITASESPETSGQDVGISSGHAGNPATGSNPHDHH
jgi:hypothetical protein